MQPLQKGQQYVVKAGGGQLFCRTDFEKEIFLMQQTVGSPQPGNNKNGNLKLTVAYRQSRN